MSRRVKTALAVVGVVLVVLVVLHLVAAPLMASLAHFVHGR
jgi:hypothetical protein